MSLSNPFRDEATIEFGYTVDRATISIVDIYGKLIEQHEITNQNTFKLQIRIKQVVFTSWKLKQELHCSIQKSLLNNFYLVIILFFINK